MTTTSIDDGKLEAFMGQAVTDMGAVISAPLFIIGEKLGLYRAMAHAGPLTSDEVAVRAGVAERSVREWLRNQAAGGYVTYDPETDRYTPRSSPTRTGLSRRSAPATAWGGTSTTIASSTGPSGSSGPGTAATWSPSGSRR